jgi:uncharacterized protein YbjT (DUF2867 family)
VNIMANTGTILITGATGTVGGAVLDHLRTADVRVRTLARDEAKAHSLKDRGVEAAIADFLQPESLDPALGGVGVVFLLTPISRDQVAQAKNVIQAAMRSGRHPRIVRLSVHQAGRDAPTRVSRQHAEIEEAVVSSELPYTLLRPQSFMQNTLMAAPTVAADATIFGAFQAGRLGMIDARDIGEVAARVATEEGHEGKVYTLTGPSAISFDDVAEALTDVLGKDVRYVDVPLEAAKEAMLRRGVPE